jgi:hypothetical protein
VELPVEPKLKKGYSTSEAEMYLTDP